MRIKMMTAPPGVREVDERLKQVRQEKEAAIEAQEFEKAAALRDKEKQVIAEKRAMEEEWRKPEVQRVVEVTEREIADVVSMWTGIPVASLTEEETEKLLRMETSIHERIVGQDEAVTAVSRAIRRTRAGLKDPARPAGSFIFLGPSGVGKTELAKAVADLMFGGERFLTTVNMSEFQEAHTVSRLIGSPPGYVGFGEGGVLTEAVRRQPYSVVLMDEVEKAHLDVVNLFYQVFDKGTLADGEGREINFRDTVLFLTSNLASDIIARHCAGSKRPDPKELVEAIRPVLSQHFKPALLARMTIVPFYQLDPSFMKEIVTLRMEKLAERLRESNKMELVYSPEVLKRIASRCQEVETGARTIDHIMRGTILPQLAAEILASMSEGNLPSSVRLGAAKDGGFSVRFKE